MPDRLAVLRLEERAEAQPFASNQRTPRVLPATSVQLRSGLNWVSALLPRVLFGFERQAQIKVVKPLDSFVEALRLVLNDVTSNLLYFEQGDEAIFERAVERFGDEADLILTLKRRRSL